MASAFSLRIHQAVDHLRPEAPGPVLPADLYRYLVPEAQAAFSRLPQADQHHLVRVSRQVSDVVADDQDLITAALLHDIGKTHGGVRVRVVDRAAKVILERVRPSLLHRLADQSEPPRFIGGLWVLSRHCKTGAALIRQWGYPERVAWLVAHHEDTDTDDAGLRLLIDIDCGRNVEA